MQGPGRELSSLSAAVSDGPPSPLRCASTLCPFLFAARVTPCTSQNAEPLRPCQAKPLVFRAVKPSLERVTWLSRGSQKSCGFLTASPLLTWGRSFTWELISKIELTCFLNTYVGLLGWGKERPFLKAAVGRPPITVEGKHLLKETERLAPGLKYTPSFWDEKRPAA